MLRKRNILKPINLLLCNNNISQICNMSRFQCENNNNNYKINNKHDNLYIQYKKSIKLILFFTNFLIIYSLILIVYLFIIEFCCEIFF